MTLATDFLRAKGIRYQDLLIPSWERQRGLDYLEIYKVRSEYIQRFGFAILTDSMIEAMRFHNPIVEIGAGSAYWAFEMKKAGLDVIATEPYPERSSRYANADWKMFTDFEKLSGPRAAAKYEERTLLIVWPDYARDWAAKTLTFYKGPKVIYVGEGSGGCTANDRFHNILEKDFKEMGNIGMPQFDGIHDTMTVYTRKGKA